MLWMTFSAACVFTQNSTSFGALFSILRLRTHGYIITATVLVNIMRFWTFFVVLFKRV